MKEQWAVVSGGDRLGQALSTRTNRGNEAPGVDLARQVQAAQPQLGHRILTGKGAFPQASHLAQAKVPGQADLRTLEPEPASWRHAPTLKRCPHREPPG